MTLLSDELVDAWAGDLPPPTAVPADAKVAWEHFEVAMTDRNTAARELKRCRGFIRWVVAAHDSIPGGAVVAKELNDPYLWTEAHSCLPEKRNEQ